MKTLISILGGLLFALLFHNQLLGVNTLIFAVFLTTVLVVLKKNIEWTALLIISIIALLSSSVAITWHGSLAAKWSYFASLLLFLGFIASSKSSIYISAFNGIYNVILGMFHEFIYPSQTETNKLKTETKYGELFLTIMIPLVLVFVFISFYSQANPVFHRWLENFYIEIDTIDFLWFFTASLATFLMLNIIEPKAILEITSVDMNASEKLHPSFPSDPKSNLKSELRIGTYSIIALNVLLLFVLISEFMFLTNLADFDIVSLSNAVHQGVYSSIISIVFAVLIIAFVFRGAINWIKKNKLIKGLAYTWMILNLMLLGTIALKNMAYIHQYGLTGKRVGVLIYLILCLVGIVTAFIKINSQMNFRFLVRKNLNWSYSILAIFALVNWSSLITRYNIEHDHVDLEQLQDLLPQNILVLKEYNLYDTIENNYENRHYSMEWKVKNLKDRSWQEFNMIAFKMNQNEK